MRREASKKHSIDLLFPITLFLVLTVSAFVLLSLSANIYKSTTERSYRNHQSRIALSYVSEKIHQSEHNGWIQIGSFEECDTLMIRQSFQEETYYTYLYFYDGALRELFFKDGTAVSPTDGKAILNLADVSMKMADEGLFYFQCTDLAGQVSDSYVSFPIEDSPSGEAKELP